MTPRTISTRFAQREEYKGFLLWMAAGNTCTQVEAAAIAGNISTAYKFLRYAHEVQRVIRIVEYRREGTRGAAKAVFAYGEGPDAERPETTKNNTYAKRAYLRTRADPEAWAKRLKRQRAKPQQLVLQRPVKVTPSTYTDLLSALTGQKL